MDGISSTSAQHQYSCLDRLVRHFGIQVTGAQHALDRGKAISEELHDLCQDGLDCILEFNKDERATEKQALQLEYEYRRYITLLKKVISLESTDVALVADLNTFKVHTEDRIVDLTSRLDERQSTNQKVKDRLDLSAEELANRFWLRKSA